MNHDPDIAVKPVADRRRVSVIMIFFDAARFMAEAIESVLDQSWPHWELLLVDDGSTDSSRDIAERYRRLQPDRIHILEHPGRENRGMSASRNLGLGKAKGDYVAFLDADDVFLPSRLERHAELLAQHRDAGAIQSCVESWRSWPDAFAERRPDVPENPPPIRLGEPFAPPELLLLMLESQGATVPRICSLTVRREVMQEIGGSDDEFRAHYEDQVLYAKIYLSTRVVVIADRLAKYRQHGESLTGRVTNTGVGAIHRWYVGRSAFLSWLESWLIARNIEDELLWQSLQGAKRAMRNGMVPDLRRRLLATLRRAAEAMLPHALSAPLVDWWGRRKLAFVDRRTAATQEKIARKLENARKRSRTE